jgi:hypothetical protein
MLPSNAATAPVTASFASQLPPPDANATNELQQQYDTSQDTQSPQTQPASGTGISPIYGGPAGTQTISLGQSINDVIDILGQPTRIADLGSKKVYVFKELKVTFVDGRVTDVQ